MITDVTKSDRGWQIGGILLLLSIMFVVFYFAGGTEYVADHASTVSSYIQNQYESASASISELLADDVVDSTVPAVEGENAGAVQRSDS